MRKINMMTTVVAGALALGTTNLTAQGTEGATPAYGRPQSDRVGQPSKEMEHAQNPAEASNLKASTISGLPVRNESGENLGKVQDLIVNLQTHAARFAIVEYGGTLGIGATRVAVPAPDLKWSAETRGFILTATKAQFDAASPTATGDWAAFMEEDWTKNVDRYYGQPTALSLSRYERQEAFGMGEGREGVRNPADAKGASQLLDQPPATDSSLGELLAKPADKDVTAKVNDLIRQNVGAQADRIQAATDKGVVTLKGTVPGDAQKKKLVQEIMALPGVTRVEDELIIGRH